MEVFIIKLNNNFDKDVVDSSSTKNLKGKAKIKTLYSLVTQLPSSNKDDKDLLKIKEDLKSNIKGNENDLLNIEGSKEAVNLVQSIKGKKIDVITSFNNITLNDIIDDKVLDLSINSKEENIRVKTKYSSMKTFLSITGHLDKNVPFAVNNGKKDLALNYVDNMISIMKDNQYRYRLININDGQFLRAIVTPNYYKILDNTQVVAIALSAINQLDMDFTITELDITDSILKMRVFQNKYIPLSNGISLKLGFLIENSEIADGAVKFHIIYNINKNENNITAISNDLLKIDHGQKYSNILKNLNIENEFETYINNISQMVESLSSLNDNNKLPKDIIFRLGRKLQNARVNIIPSDLKNDFRKFLENQAKDCTNIIDLMINISNIIHSNSKYDSNEDIIEYIEAKFNEVIKIDAKY